MRLFKKREKLPTLDEVEAVLEKADKYATAMENFTIAFYKIFPETEAQKKERLAFHEQVREAWGFGRDF